jgi:hypothetical protein
MHISNNHSLGDWITIRTKKKNDKIPSEVRISRNGSVYIDGELYDESNSKYKNLSVSVERYSRLNTGEETEKMMESMKKSKKGEIVTIKDVKEPDKTESTTVKF